MGLPVEVITPMLERFMRKRIPEFPDSENILAVLAAFCARFGHRLGSQVVCSASDEEWDVMRNRAAPYGPVETRGGVLCHS